MQLAPGAVLTRTNDIGFKNRENILLFRNRTLLILAVFFLAPHLCNADIILEIDAGAKEYRFVGADSGMTETSSSGSIEWVQWRIQDNSGFGNVSFDTPFSWSGWSPLDNFATVSTNDLQPLRQINIVGAAIISSGPIPVSLTAPGAVVDYSSMHVNDISWFEGLVGSSIPSTRGSGFGDIQVRAVPEPGSLACLITVVLLLSIRRCHCPIGKGSGGPGPLLTSGSHRPVRHTLMHTVPRRMGLLCGTVDKAWDRKRIVI